MDRVPRIEGFLSKGQSRRTQRHEVFHPRLTGLWQLIFRAGLVGEPPGSSFFSGDRSPGKNEVSGTFFSHQRSQSGTGDGRITTQLDLGETPFGVGGRKAQVA